MAVAATRSMSRRGLSRCSGVAQLPGSHDVQGPVDAPVPNRRGGGVFSSRSFAAGSASSRDSGHGNFLVDGHDSRALRAVTDRDEVGPRSWAMQCRTLALAPPAGEP